MVEKFWNLLEKCISQLNVLEDQNVVIIGVNWYCSLPISSHLGPYPICSLFSMQLCLFIPIRNLWRWGQPFLQMCNMEKGSFFLFPSGSPTKWSATVGSPESPSSDGTVVVKCCPQKGSPEILTISFYTRGKPLNFPSLLHCTHLFTTYASQKCCFYVAIQLSLSRTHTNTE